MALMLALAIESHAVVPPLEQVPGFVPPQPPSCVAPLQAAMQPLMAGMDGELASCGVGGGAAAGLAGAGGVIGQVGQAIQAGKQNAQELGSKSKLDIVTGAASGGSSAARVQACPSFEVPNVEDMTCAEVTNDKALTAMLTAAAAGAKCANDSLAAAQCALDAVAKASAGLENLGAQVCGPLFDGYLTAAQASAALHQRIVEERKEQIKAIEGKLGKVQQAGKLIQQKQAEIKGKLEAARRNARNIAARRAALIPAREANKISLVMQCVQDEVIPGAKCNPGDATAPSYSVKEYIERCWLKSLGSTGNLSGEAAGAKAKRQAAAEQVKSWLSGLTRKAPAGNAEYDVEKAGTDVQVIGAIPSSGISNLRELNGYIGTFPGVDADAGGSMKKVLRAGIQACWDNGTIEQQLNTRWNAVGKKIVADEEDMLRFHKNDLTDVQYTHNDISTFLTDRDAKIDTSNCESANRIESVQACLETYETNLKQFLTGDEMLKQIQYDRQPDGTLKQKVTLMPNPFAAVPLGFPTSDPALAALAIPPVGDAVNSACRGVNNCNAKLTQMKTYAESQGKAAEAYKKKITQDFQGAATAFKSGVTNLLGAASAQIRNRLQQIAPLLAKARVGGAKLKNVDASETMDMSGKEPSEGVPAPGQNWSEIFNTGANLLDPSSLKPEELEERQKDIKDAIAKINRQANLKESRRAECLKLAAEKMGNKFTDAIGQIKSGRCMLEPVSAGDYKNQLRELATALRGAGSLDPVFSAEFAQALAGLDGLINTRGVAKKTEDQDGLPLFENCSAAVNNLTGLKTEIGRAQQASPSSTSAEGSPKK